MIREITKKQFESIFGPVSDATWMWIRTMNRRTEMDPVPVENLKLMYVLSEEMDNGEYDTGIIPEPNYLEHMVESNPDVIFFFVTDSTDIWGGDPINYKDLLTRYIEHVGTCEGTDFLNVHHRRESVRLDGPEFTDEEWAAMGGVF